MVSVRQQNVAPLTGHGPSARRIRVLLAIGVVAALVSACVTADSSGTPTGSEGEASVSIPPATVAAPSPSPSPSLTVSIPTPSPSPTPPAAVDGTLVARIFVYPDVTVGRVPPMLSVYTDGRVLSPSRSADTMNFVVRRLTPEGLAKLRSGLEGSGFFAGDIEIPPTQVTNSGYTTYAVSLRLGDRLVTARTTNFAMSAKGRALVDLAEGWTHPERELPVDAWLPGQSAYEASRWYLALRLLPDFASTQAVDSTALEAAVGDLALFGRLVQSSEDGSVVRCGPVDAAAVERIVAALVAAGLYRAAGDAEYYVDMRWVGGNGSVTLGAYVMLPDDPLECPADIFG